MVQGFHPDQLEKTHFLIGYKNYLHQDEIPGPCQTQSIFSICFLGLSRHHGSKKIILVRFLKIKRLEITF